jgi:hypothetical protein
VKNYSLRISLNVVYDPMARVTKVTFGAAEQAFDFIYVSNAEFCSDGFAIHLHNAPNQKRGMGVRYER